jgi:hypothetical protein
MEYSLISTRFFFFNGKEQYTVQYNFGLCKWYVFKDDEHCNCVFKKTDNKIKNECVNDISAMDILIEFLNR